MGGNEIGSTIKDYESSNMNAISTRLRSESPRLNNGKQLLDQFRNIDILEPSCLMIHGNQLKQNIVKKISTFLCN